MSGHRIRVRNNPRNAVRTAEDRRVSRQRGKTLAARNLASNFEMTTDISAYYRAWDAKGFHADFPNFDDWMASK